MKFLSPQIAYLLNQREHRQNLRALVQYLAFLTATVVVYSVLFHLLMLQEGQEHSWITGFYWTLTVMSTLGFGDITFHSDAGRLFSMGVLLSGIVLLLIVLPFVFIRSLYAPWLEAQLSVRAPRRVKEDVEGHVIFCRSDEIAEGTSRRLADLGIPSFVIEPNPTTAATMHADGIQVVTGELDSGETYEAMRSERAALVVANLSDAGNSNVALTVRERFPDVRLAAFAEEEDSVDVLEFSGANLVIPLKQRLGESLASRVAVGPAHAELVGRFEDLHIAEFPVAQSGLAGRTIRDTRLRQITGLNIVACLEAGHLVAARPDTVLTEHSVAIVMGTEDQIAELDALFVIYSPNENPVLVIGGGKVGRATCEALRRKEVATHLIESDTELRSQLVGVADRVILGDASHRQVLMDAGLMETPTVVLTSHDDAINIFLSIYCRRLNPAVRIVARVTHDRNLDAIHRAGADVVLSYTNLAVKSLLAEVLGADPTFVGESIDLIVEPVPASLAGTKLAESQIAEKTDLNVVALQLPDGTVEHGNASMELLAGADLVMLGSAAQRSEFRRTFG